MLVQHAERLYAEARFIILRHAILGSVLGFVGGLVGGAVLGGFMGGAEVPFALIGMVVLVSLFTAVGILVGRERAFLLKLQAQTALCQVQIEINTRRQ